ncbi:non-ribosomal peptide synthetase [Leptolyngbya sp. AN02str]|uniref:non-ribosomal peptide synthetase n=1 Tax=Leptolyngbya sp. AN02str TaxID=3423363 RepID=UPI003D3205EC
MITGFKLSPQQRHLWSLHPDSGAYVAQSVISLRGDVDEARLRAALEGAIARHDILRTTFVRPAGMMPLQVVEAREEAQSYWQPLDWSLGGESEQTQKTQLEALLQAERSHRYHLDQAPLVRAVWVRCSTQRHWLVLTLPSLCADAQTLNALFDELIHLYAGQAADVSSVEVQYAEYAEWQNQVQQADPQAEYEVRVGQNFWRQQPVPPPLTPPLRNRTAVPERFWPSCHSVHLSEAAIAQVQEQSRRWEVSPAVFLLSCWQVLLWRHAAQAQMAIAVACDGRQYAELEAALGPFVRYLPLHTELQNDTCFHQLLRHTQEAWQGLTEWQDYFPERGTHAPCPAIAFDWVEWAAERTVDGLTFAVEHQRVYGDRTELRLTGVSQAERLHLELHYEAELFSPEAIACVARQLQTLIHSATADPTVAIARLNLLANEERLHLLQGWPRASISSTFTADQTPAPDSSECIHHWFERQVGCTPQHMALVYEDQQVTYRELNHRANQLAHYLQQAGAQPDRPIAIYLERSLDVMVAMLAVLKAGSAYLPLDISLPSAGVQARLLDAQAEIVLTHAGLLPSFSPEVAQVVCLDRDWGAIAQHSTENPASSATPAHLAYLLYTSGSTGQPKAVAVEHRQLLHYVHSVVERLDLPAIASYATVSTLAADLGNTMIFPCLCRGGTLHLIAAERVADAQAFAAYCVQHPIDCLKIVPSHLQALLTSSNSAAIVPRQRLILGGEVCRWTLIEQIQTILAAQSSSCRIFNHYGPTETTVGVLTYPVELGQTERSPAASVPLGWAIAHTQVYLLDEHLDPVPMGVPGALYVGGRGVSRGYYGRPGLTASRFLPNPFATTVDAAGRLYQTGDLARYLPDGSLEFLGRLDQQIKLRGFRVELGEIEAQLLHHPQIKEAAVVAHADSADQPLLVAYVVTHAVSGAPAIAPSDLRQFLQTRLPVYLIPTTFVCLKALPLTRNGKVNRAALPPPETVSLNAQAVAPRTPTEAAIAAIWAEVLGRETVGIHQDFFALGGHSLLATQVLSRLRDQFEVELPLRQLFEAQTVAELAAVVEAALLADIAALTEAEAERQMAQASEVQL